MEVLRMPILGIIKMLWVMQSHNIAGKDSDFKINMHSFIPHGVLCFFPSYSLLDKMVNRWKNTGVWTQLSNFKKIIIGTVVDSKRVKMLEPQNSNDGKFSSVMEDYYETIRRSSSSNGKEKGAIFLAVCRGKV